MAELTLDEVLADARTWALAEITDGRTGARRRAEDARTDADEAERDYLRAVLAAPPERWPMYPVPAELRGAWAAEWTQEVVRLAAGALATRGRPS